MRVILSLLSACEGDTASDAPADTAEIAEIADTAAPEPGAVAGEVVEIPPGSYERGCRDDADTLCDNDESPAHVVTLTRAFALMATEVTRGFWAGVDAAAEDPSSVIGITDDTPVETASWRDATAFANALSEADGLTPCYTLDGDDVTWPDGLDCLGWRLPTEAEWEYAARAGTDTRYAGSDDVDAVAWHAENCGGVPRPVATMAPNAWGLYDMSGNVYEWTWDAYGAYDADDAEDPVSSGDALSFRVFRGGSWGSAERHHRVNNRGRDEPDHRDWIVGLRLARTL